MEQNSWHIGYRNKNCRSRKPNINKTSKNSSGGRRDGKGYLTLARLQAIVNEIPNDYSLQERVAKTVVDKNITAKQASVFTAAIAQARDAGRTSEVDQLLEDPSNFLSQIVLDPRGPSYDNDTLIVYDTPSYERDTRDEQLRLQAELIATLQQQVIDLRRQLDQEKNGDLSILEESYTLATKTGGVKIVFEAHNYRIYSTSNNLEVSLTKTETNLLRVLISQSTNKVPIEIFSLYAMAWKKPIPDDLDVAALMRGHIFNLKAKIKKVSPLLAENLQNEKGIGYKWVSSLS